jgi:predicted HAD superfamily Cof-like phosphohydrolase
MNKSFADMVQQFMTACGQFNPRFDEVSNEDFYNQVALYQKLIEEEYNELQESVTGDANWVKESCDLIWVIIARMLSLGVDVNSAFAELSRSNMSKTVDGKVIRRADGKVLKPEGYSDANMTPTLLRSKHNN